MIEMDAELQAMLMAFESEAYGLTLEEIGVRYDTSAATVARRQNMARDSGYVQSKVALSIPEKYKRSFLQCLSYGKMEKRLMEALQLQYKSLLRRITVVPSESPKKERQSVFPHNAGAVAFHAAGWLRNDIHHIHKHKGGTVNIGLHYGFLVNLTCLSLRDVWADKELRRMTPRISSLIGVHTVDPQTSAALAFKSWENSSVANCRIFAGAFQEPHLAKIDRINLPAQVMDRQPSTYSENERKLLQSLFAADPAYRYLYGEDRPVLATGEEVDYYRRRRKEEKKYEAACGKFLDLDIVITGLSALEAGSGFFDFAPSGRADKLRHLRAEEHICGEVASHLFMHDGSVPRRDHPQHGTTIGAMNSLQVGLYPEDLMDLAQANRDNQADAGGVLMCCSGQQKAASLFGLLTSGVEMVNHAFIDLTIAEYFYEKLGIKEAHWQHDLQSRDRPIEEL